MAAPGMGAVASRSLRAWSTATRLWISSSSVGVRALIRLKTRPMPNRLSAHARTPPTQLEPRAAVFYGVRPAVAHLWAQAKRERPDWYVLQTDSGVGDRRGRPGWLARISRSLREEHGAGRVIIRTKQVLPGSD